MKRLLILGGPIFQYPIICKAKRMGLEVGVVDINPDSPVACAADRFFNASILDKSQIMDVAREFMPDAVISGACDTSVNMTAWLCDQLGLAGIGREAARRSTDKVEMLKAFEASGVAHPEYQVVRHDDVSNFALKVPYPLITKPIDSAGGRGVNLVQDEGELSRAVRMSSDAGVSGDILVEEYLRGHEVSVEVIIADGTPHVLQITDKYTSGAPNFYEVGHSQPAVLDSKMKDRIVELASAAVLSVGLKNSAAHVEMMITPSGPKMIELGARMGGDCISTYLVDSSVNGIDMAEAMIRLSFGETLDVWNYEDSGQYCAVKFLPSKKGRLIEIRGEEVARQLPGVIRLEVTGRVGGEYRDAVDDSSRFAFVVCRASTLDAANGMCERALAHLEFVLEPLD